MNLRSLAAAMAACLTLVACAAPNRIAQPGRTVDTARSGSAAEIGRTQALSFLEVQARVEPLAEAECRRQNPRANCDFRIVVDDRPGMPPNAYQTLERTGRPLIAFTTALVAQIRNPDELALVMSHEAAHHIAGHLGRMDRNASVGAAAFGRLASQEAGATADSIRQAQVMGAQIAARTFSKEFELEADRLGAVMAALAGYDPVRGADFFRRIPDPGNRLMGTHPSNAERIAAVRAAAAGLGR